ncbi:MAG: hypothetical protein V3T55_01275 [Anaerolineales bacterium]
MVDMNKETFTASWIDNLISWINQLPIPAWLFYMIAYLLLILLVHVTAWTSGIIPFGSFGPFAIQLPIWLILPLAYIHYLDRVAQQAMKKFHPAVNINATEFNVLTYQMSTMPTRPIWVMTGIGSVLSVALVVINPAIFQPLSKTTLRVVILLAIGIPTGWFGWSFLYHTVRQLRMVNNMHKRIEAINLFDLEPIHAFSLLTARTSVVLIVLVGLATILNTVLELREVNDLLLLLFATLISMLAIATFAIPLWGIHERLVEEKQRIEAENNRRIVVALFELHRRMDDTDYEDMSQFRNGISGLLSFRAELKQVSTWPWQPGTLRGLLTAVFLPIILWTIQQSLSQIMDY